MKTTKEILAQITTTREKIGKINERAKVLYDDRKFDLTNLKGKSESEKEDFKKEYDRINAEIVKISSEKEVQEEKLHILTSNYRIALYAESMPIIAEILTKYANKKIGSKTEEKIRNEITEKLPDIWFYFSKGYDYNRPYIGIDDKNRVLGHGKHIEVRFWHDTPMFDDDGKLNMLDMEYIDKAAPSTYKPDYYVENPTEYAENIITEKQAIEEEYKKLSSRVSAFNSMCRNVNGNYWHVTLNK